MYPIYFSVIVYWLDMLQLLEYVHQQLHKKHLREHPPLENALPLPEVSAVVDAFEGTIARKRICPAGHTSTSTEVFRVLPLQFPQEVRYTMVVMLF